MATKEENKPVGTAMHKKHKEKLTKTGRGIQNADVQQDGDAEAGVDAQEEQLNDMPNDPTDRPLEKKKNTKK